MKFSRRNQRRKNYTIRHNIRSVIRMFYQNRCRRLKEGGINQDMREVRKNFKEYISLEMDFTKV